MARILIVVASRREGNCFNLGKKIKEELKKERIVSSIIIPGNQKIYLCTGCMDCDENSVCDFNDDMSENIDKILKSDAVIFITPTRFNLLSGDLKIFLDRLNPLTVPQSLKDKKAIIIGIGSSKEEEFSVNGAVTSVDSFCENNSMNVIGKYAFYNCLEAEDILKQDDKINTMLEEIKTKLK